MCQAASCKKQWGGVPRDFSINTQTHPTHLATPHHAATLGLRNSSSSGGQEPALLMLQGKGKGLEMIAALTKAVRTRGGGRCLVLDFLSYTLLWLRLPWKHRSQRGDRSLPIPAGGEQGTAGGGPAGAPSAGAEIHRRLQGGEKSPRQHISPGSPTLFISIIKSANTYHLSKICSNNKHRYRAYYGQWWAINLYPWKEGRKAGAELSDRGQSLLRMRPTPFPLWRGRMENCIDIFVGVFYFFSFKIMSVFIWSSYRNKWPGYYLSVPVSAGNICLRGSVCWFCTELKIS